MPAASASMPARRDITAFRSAMLILAIRRESNTIVSWRGDLKPKTGCNVFLIACLLNDAIVVRKASPDSMLSEDPVELCKGLNGDLRSAGRHRRTRRRIEHPCRNDYRRTRLAFDQHDIDPGTLFRIEPADRAPMQRVPPVMDRHILPDTGRITPR
jgi:hypothetical protein